MSQVTRILNQIEKGDPMAADELLPLVYDELRKLAAQRLANEKPGQTLQATALVHEAYIRLVDVERVQQWNSRGHFFGAAAEAMRRILVDNARRKKCEKHGGSLRKVVDLDKVRIGLCLPPDIVLIINDTLEKLAESDPEAAEIVKLRCFGGLSVEDAAHLLGIPVRSAYRDWAFAKAYLFRNVEQASQIKED